MSLRKLLEAFLDNVETKLTGDHDFDAEFQKLRDYSITVKKNDYYVATAGAREENLRKNRYKDILPFDCTRVKLNPALNPAGSDYINASFVAGHHGRVAYIASQGPMPHTVDDFWAMLWQYNTKVVIMACNEREAGKAKCERYWPYAEEEKSFRDIHITLVSEERFCEDFLMRKLKATKGSEVHEIYQFHYVQWPDHGVPTTVTPLLDMVAMFRQIQPGDGQPLVVHCSAGCGRTGTIIAIDYSWNVLKAGTLTEGFNLFDVVMALREQRPSSVQAKDQYILVHQAVSELFERHLNLIEDHDYENITLAEDEKEQVEDVIYEDCRPRSPGGSEDVYSNLQLILSSGQVHPSERVIKDTISNMWVGESWSSDKPEKVYGVSKRLSEINAKVMKENTSKKKNKVDARTSGDGSGKKSPVERISSGPSLSTKRKSGNSPQASRGNSSKKGHDSCDDALIKSLRGHLETKDPDEMTKKEISTPDVQSGQKQKEGFGKALVDKLRMFRRGSDNPGLEKAEHPVDDSGKTTSTDQIKQKPGVGGGIIQPALLSPSWGGKSSTDGSTASHQILSKSTSDNSEVKNAESGLLQGTKKQLPNVQFEKTSEKSCHSSNAQVEPSNFQEQHKLDKKPLHPPKAKPSLPIKPEKLPPSGNACDHEQRPTGTQNYSYAYADCKPKNMLKRLEEMEKENTNGSVEAAPATNPRLKSSRNTSESTEYSYVSLPALQLMNKGNLNEKISSSSESECDMRERCTKPLPSWVVKGEDGYSNLVGKGKKSDGQTGDDSGNIYSVCTTDFQAVSRHPCHDPHPCNSAVSTPKEGSSEAVPPLPIKTEGAFQTLPVDDITDSKESKSNKSKIGKTFGVIKHRLQWQPGKSIDSSNMDNISVKSEDFGGVATEIRLGFPARINKPKGPRERPWKLP